MVHINTNMHMETPLKCQNTAKMYNLNTRCIWVGLINIHGAASYVFYAWKMKQNILLCENTANMHNLMAIAKVCIHGQLGKTHIYISLFYLNVNWYVHCVNEHASKLI